jgi:eukaryotic-like serine/threonine-protein kinase
VVYVSTGPPVVTVPDVHGRSGPDATSALEKAGFRVRTTQAFSDDVDSGVVISTDPAGGSQQRKFSTITVTVSKGPEFIAIPDIPRFTPLATAQQALADAGFTNVGVQVVLGGGDGQTVLAVKPKSGELARRDDRILLLVF